MVDTKSPGDKTLSVPTKTLTLKPRVETGTVRQSFSHGRTKQVVVGPRTRRALGRRGRPRLGSRPLAFGARGWDVAALQFLLETHGFPLGRVDGGFGAGAAGA